MKRNRFITFGVFVLGGAILILSVLFNTNNFYIVSTLCFVLFLVVFIPTLLDPHLKYFLRISLLVIGLFFLLASLVGLLIHEENLPTHTYCLIFALLEVLNGVAEFCEGVDIVKEKNYVMGALFIVDALIEITLGVLMTIERDETLRIHITLISADLFFEGIIKLINEFIEERRGIHD